MHGEVANREEQGNLSWAKFVPTLRPISGKFPQTSEIENEDENGPKPRQV